MTRVVAGTQLDRRAMPKPPGVGLRPGIAVCRHAVGGKSRGYRPGRGESRGGGPAHRYETPDGATGKVVDGDHSTGRGSWCVGRSTPAGSTGRSELRRVRRRRARRAPPNGADSLGTLKPQRVFATGDSQSSARLTSAARARSDLNSTSRMRSGEPVARYSSQASVGVRVACAIVTR
jgi:hypothetical protein